MTKCSSKKYKIPCTKKFGGKTYQLMDENSDYRKHAKVCDDLEEAGADYRGTSFERKNGKFVYGVYVRD